MQEKFRKAALQEQLKIFIQALLLTLLNIKISNILFSCLQTRLLSLPRINYIPALKKIQKDYVDYLTYGSWLAKVQKIEKLLNEVVEHYSEKIADAGGITLASGNICTTTCKGNLVVDGIGDIAEEINKLKADVEKIKKKIKKPRKKPVIKESKKQE